MRAAAILGLGTSPRHLSQFQEDSRVTWLNGMPATSADADAILIFGGDGTIHRHLAELVRLQIPVLVVPCGSANDFARALGFRSVHSALAAWRNFVATRGNTRQIDLGVITAEKGGGNRRYFCCVAGVGIDTEIARAANALPRWLRGYGGYALLLPPMLARFKPVMARITTTTRENSYPGFRPIIVAAFANTPIYGGGMKIAPHAKLDDGLLDLCIVNNMNKLALLTLFPTIYFGRHLSVRQVFYSQTARFAVQTEPSTDIYADGEYVCQTPAEVSIAPRALTVIVPSIRAEC